MNNNLFYRHFELTREDIQEENRSVEVSISSEAPIMRWFGTEIILHGKDNIDFSRLNSALLNHNPDKIIGRITDARVERKKARATITFDDDDLGNQAFAKVQSGSLKGISIGYMIEKAKEVKADEEWRGIKGPAMVATKTAIYEASLTPIPADATVGVGRDFTRSLDGIEIEGCSKLNQEVVEMTREEVLAIITEALGELKVPKADDIAQQVRNMLVEDARPKLRISGEEFVDLTTRAGAVSPECKLKVTDLIGDGKTAEEIKNFILDQATKRSDASDSGGKMVLNDKAKGKGPVSSFKQIEDDEFFVGLTNPAAFALN